MTYSAARECSTAVAVAAIAFLSCAPPSHEGLSLLHKLQDAVGGADRIAAVRDLDQTILGTSWDQNGQRIGEVRKRVRWVRPNHLRLDQVGPGDTFVLYYDGTTGWEILPDGRTLDLVGGEERFARRYLRSFFLVELLADRDPTYAIDSPQPNVLRIVDREDEANPVDLWLDPTSSLPLRETATSLADPTHPRPMEKRYAEWEPVDGIRFARRFSVFHADLHLADAVLERTVVNPGLDPADLARKPSDGKPVMAGR